MRQTVPPRASRPYQVALPCSARSVVGRVLLAGALTLLVAPQAALALSSSPHKTAGHRDNARGIDARGPGRHSGVTERHAAPPRGPMRWLAGLKQRLPRQLPLSRAKFASLVRTVKDKSIRTLAGTLATLEHTRYRVVHKTRKGTQGARSSLEGLYASLTTRRSARKQAKAVAQMAEGYAELAAIPQEEQRGVGILGRLLGRSPRLKRLLLTTAFLLAGVTFAHAANVTLRWDPNNPAPKGYRVFAREGSQPYNYDRPWWENALTTCTLSGLKEGVTYHFVVRAFDGPLESKDSEEVSFRPPVADSSAAADPSSAATDSKKAPGIDGSTGLTTAKTGTSTAAMRQTDPTTSASSPTPDRSTARDVIRVDPGYVPVSRFDVKGPAVLTEWLDGLGNPTEGVQVTNGPLTVTFVQQGVGYNPKDALVVVKYPGTQDSAAAARGPVQLKTTFNVVDPANPVAMHPAGSSEDTVYPGEIAQFFVAHPQRQPLGGTWVVNGQVELTVPAPTTLDFGAYVQE